MAGRGGISAARARLSSVALATALGTSVLWSNEPPSVPPVQVTVDGRPVTVRSDWPLVEDALRAVGKPPDRAALRSVVTHRPLPIHTDGPQVRLDGRPVRPRHPLRQGARVTTAGGDVVEPTRVDVVTLPAANLPPVEDRLWQVTVPGKEEVEMGVHSGEVVRRTVVVPPGPAVPVTTPLVALTFDDGPDPRHTPTLLKILRDKGVKATFCMVGYAARRHPELVRAISDEGHAICNHTERHVMSLGRRRRATIEAEIGPLSDFLRGVIGKDPTFYRAPGGTLSPAVIEVARSHNLRVLHWTVDSSDYRHGPPSALIERIMAGIKPGAVVLLHDGGDDGARTVAIMPELLDRLRRAGYRSVTPVAPS
jgi:peptidoglycan/xylan/chitin deacetylase (PgdA/CDA1 family)